MLEKLAESLTMIAALAPAWKFTLVFVFMAVESSFIPFPSEVVMIPAGFFAATGALGLESVSALALAVALGVAGSLAGAYVNYALSLWLGKPFLVKYGKWFFVKRAPLERACEVFNRYGAATTFVCRLVPVIRQLISIPAGIARMPLKSFTVFTALGAGIWSALLGAVGLVLGRAAANYRGENGAVDYFRLVSDGKAAVSQNLVWVLLAAAVLVALYYIAGKLVMGRRKQ